MGNAIDPWSIETVDARFRDAAITARKLPRVRVAGYVSFWPTIIYPEQLRSLDTEARPLRFPPTHAEVGQMLETMRWVQWLEVEQRHLVWMRAERHRWGEIAKRFGCASRTAQRRCDAAMHLIALHLNKGH